MIQPSRRFDWPVVLLTSLAAVVFGTPMVQAQSYLFNRADFPIGLGPSAVIIADFNGDGRLDLAVANQADNTVSILLGIPGGTFAPERSYATGTSPAGLISADFNGDGKLDLAVVNYLDNTVSVLLGNGDGTFQPHTDYATGIQPFAVVAADFNGDGKIDLAIANADLMVGSTPTVSILLGNGDGSFAAQTPVVVGAQPMWLASGDFNGDGKVDLITSNIGDGTVTVLLSNGNGTFTRVDSPSGLIPGPNRTELAVGDFNGDGKLDVVVSSESAQLFLLLGNGDGSFQPPAIISNSVAGGFYVLLAGDFNHDGKLDLAQQAGELMVLLGNGDGTFQSPVASPLGLSTVTSLATADFNGDGAPDLVATDINLNSVDVFLGNGDGTFGVATFVPLTTNYYFNDAAVVADFNGDGKLDLAIAEANFPNGQISVQLGNGDGTFQPPIISPLTIQGINNNGVMVVGDFNGDGKPDLVILDDYSTGFEVLMGNGGGTFQTPVNTPLSYTVLSLAVGDFNGDGKADAVTTTNGSGPGLNPVMNIYLGKGDGSFRMGAAYVVPAYANVVVADVNQDGKADLIVTSFGAPLEVFLGNGDGTFKSPITGPAAIFSGTPVVADFNGDGKPDIAVGTYSGIAFLAGNGDGTFRAPVYSDCGSAQCSGTPGLGFNGQMVVGDFNGDGKLDLASSPPFDTVLGGPVVMVGNGDGTFQPPFAYGGGGAPIIPLAGDFNSDGISDLAVPGSTGVILYLSGPTLDFFPGALVFEPQDSGTTSPAQQVKLTNQGPGALTLSGIEATGDFPETNDCGTRLTKGESCVIAVTFRPTASGLRSGTISFTDDAAANPQIVSLAGTGYGPFVGISPTSLTFASQFVGSSSPAQSITILNTGTAQLSIGEIAVSGPQASDFLQTNTCGNTLAAGANCIISVLFTPSAIGIRNATISVIDNAAGSPQVVPVSGTGMSLGLAIPPGQSGSATVPAGAIATFSLVVGGAGFAGTATLTCTGAPTGAACLVPSSIALDAASASAVVVTVTTTPRISAVLVVGHAPWLWSVVVIGGLLLHSLGHKRSTFQRLSGSFLLIMLAIFLCGCGSSSSTQTNPNGTPAGQYTLTISAASGSENQSLPLTLLVH